MRYSQTLMQVVMPKFVQQVSKLRELQTLVEAMRIGEVAQVREQLQAECVKGSTLHALLQEGEQQRAAEAAASRLRIEALP